MSEAATNSVAVSSDLGTITICGAVDEGMLFKVALCLEDIKLKSPKDRVVILLSSSGGEVYSAFGIVDLIENFPKPVDIIAVGHCMSAGMTILQAGTRRAATLNTHLLIHFGTETHDTKDQQKHHNSLEAKMIEQFVNRTGKSKRVVNKWISKESYFTAQEALAAGLIDEVLSKPSKEA